MARGKKHTPEQIVSLLRQVRQRGRDDSALRCACLRRKQRSIFHEARLQPFPQYLLIRGDVVEHPCVADVVEAATDVALKNPLCTAPVGKRTEALLDGIEVEEPSRTSRTKTH